MRALVGSGPALSFSARSIYTSQVCHILPISRPVLARRAVLPLNATWKDEVEWAPSEVEEITSLQNSTGV